MQDRAVVAAVIAGDTDGFAAAYDQYAASLYACCHAVLPEPEAAEAVLDTFLVAAAKLDGLRDPDRFGPWLHAVARNECLRRLGPGGKIPAPADQGGEPPELPLPPGFRSRVLTACADNSPAGRAHRMSVAHRAGVFGPAGFPKGDRPVRAIVVARRPAASRRGRGGGRGGGAGRDGRDHRGHDGRRIAPAAGLRPRAGRRHAGPGVQHDAGRHERGAVPGAHGPGLGRARRRRRRYPRARPARNRRRGGATPRPPRRRSPSTSPSATPLPVHLPSVSRSPSTSPSSRSPSTSPSPATSPAPGYLTVAPGKLVLTSVSGKPVSGSFVLTAVNGPVPHYAVGVAAMASKVKVAPAAGSSEVNGKVKVTVTVTSKVALTTHVIVEPGNLTVTVVYKLKPQPSPSP